MGSSLDQIGPFALSVEDAHIIFDLLSQYDQFDAYSIPQELRNKTINKKVQKIGIPRKILSEGLSDEVRDNFENMVGKLKQEGFVFEDIDLPNAMHSLPVYYVVMPAELSTNLAKFDGIRYADRVQGDDLVDSYFKTKDKLFGPESKRRSFIGAYVLSHGYKDAFYDKAILIRNKIKDEFRNIFEKVDVIMTPTSPLPRFQRRKNKGSYCYVFSRYIYCSCKYCANTSNFSTKWP